jgi:serine protease Do
MKRLGFAIACLVVGGLVGSLLHHSFLQGQAPIAIAPFPRELTSYRDIVKKVLPAVVSIDAQASTGKKAPHPPGALADDDSPSRIGFGSGFLVSAKGVVVTNNHVVDGAEQVMVQLRDGRKFVSKDIKTDPKTDLAIVRLETKEDLPYLEFGDSEGMEIGDRVLAVGAPFGLTGTVTHGIISAKGRSLRLNLYEDFLQTDAAINPGNSGGPLVNLEGKVIGINSAIKSRSGGFQGVGLAISSNLARTIMEQLRKDGVVHRGYLGIQIRDVEEKEAGKLGLSGTRGVLLTKVFDEAPAARAGLKAGDVVVGLAGKPIRDGRQLQTVVAGLPLGKPADVEVMRDGKKQTLQVTIQEQPTAFGSARADEPKLPERGLQLDGVGIVVVEVTPEVGDALGYRAGVRGLLVSRVIRDGLAAGAGMRPGLLITAVNRKPVTTLKEIREAFRTASLEKGVLVRIEDPAGQVRQLFLQAE